MEKVHANHFTNNDEEDGNCSRIWDTCHHFEAIVHGDDEGTVEPALI
jgi:hypothetical protein